MPMLATINIQDMSRYFYVKLMTNKYLLEARLLIKFTVLKIRELTSSIRL